MDYRHRLIRIYATLAAKAYNQNPTEKNYQMWLTLFNHPCY